MGRTRHSLAFNVAQTVRVAGAVRDRLVVGQLAAAEPARTSRSPGRRPSQIGSRRSAGPRRSGDRLAGRRRRSRDGPHDARPRLAVPQHRASPRTAVVRGRHAATKSRSSGSGAEPALLEWLLDLSDSLITYRSRHLHSPEWPAVVDLLVFDAHNPRSGLFQLAKLAKHVQQLPGADSGELTDTLSDLQHLLAAFRPADAMQRELFGTSAPLEDLLASCHRTALRVSDALDPAVLQSYLRAPAGDDGGVMRGTLYRVDHETRYAHTGRASTSQHVACLKPRTLARQQVHWHELDDRPGAGHRARTGRLLRQQRPPLRDPHALRPSFAS